MTFHPTDRIALFIDGANLYSATKALGVDIDYRRLLDLFGARGVLVRAYYYTAVPEDQEYSPLRPLLDWLDYNGYALVTKPMKRYTDAATGMLRAKGNMDMEIAVDMLELAPRLDHAVLFSGDGDFRAVVAAVQRRGVRVSVVSSLRTQPPMIADELRRQADAFVELADLAAEVARPREPGGGARVGVRYPEAQEPAPDEA
jgi:uncharacterized LabA/DUF88 family protein